MPHIVSVALHLAVRADIAVTLLLIIAVAGAGRVKHSLVLKIPQPVVLQGAAALHQPAGKRVQWAALAPSCKSAGRAVTGLQAVEHSTEGKGHLASQARVFAASVP